MKHRKPKWKSRCPFYRGAVKVDKDLLEYCAKGCFTLNGKVLLVSYASRNARSIARAKMV